MVESNTNILCTSHVFSFSNILVYTGIHFKNKTFDRKNSNFWLKEMDNDHSNSESFAKQIHNA
jgi:hypothetical protein